MNPLCNPLDEPVGGCSSALERVVDQVAHEVSDELAQGRPGAALAMGSNPTRRACKRPRSFVLSITRFARLHHVSKLGRVHVQRATALEQLNRALQRER